MAALNCAKDALGFDEAAKRDGERRTEQMKSDIAQCFRQNGCEDPRPAWEAFKSCVKDKLKDGLLQDFLDCADARNIDIPPELREKMENLGEEEGHSGGGGMMMMGRFGRRNRRENPMMEQIRILIEAKCPSGAQEEVERCAEGALEDAAASARRARGQMNFMGAIACKDEISCPCMEDLSERKDAMCGCADDIIAEYSEDDYQRDLRECRDEAGVDLGSEDMYEKVTGMVEKFCSRRMPNFGC
jgi:hypothetical protein